MDDWNGTAVRTRGLQKLYGARKALAGVDLEVGKGEVFGLLGPNGGGKSTLFRVLSTLSRPTSGKAFIFGLDVEEREAEVRARIGVVFQDSSLDPKLRVEENLAYQGALYGLQGRELGRRIDGLLERFSLQDRRRDPVETLSGGLARRIEIAKGLLHRPRLLLLDEPGSGLDPGARRDLWNQLETIRSEDGTTILLTTHILEEADSCERILILDRGRAIAEGVPADLRAEVGSRVLTIETGEPSVLAKKLHDAFGCRSRVLGGSLRIETDEGNDLGMRISERFGREVRALTIGSPDLEDVFMARTGAGFSERDAEAAALEASPGRSG